MTARFQRLRWFVGLYLASLAALALAMFTQTTTIARPRVVQVLFATNESFAPGLSTTSGLPFSRYSIPPR
jgi:hypothetical protein